MQFVSNRHFKTHIFRAGLGIPVLTGISACHVSQIHRQLWLYSTRGFFGQNSQCFVLTCKDILFQISVFMLNYFNLCSCSYDLATVEILHQTGIYCDLLWPASLASCLYATRHFLNTNRTEIYISVHTVQWDKQALFYCLGRKLQYQFKEHWFHTGKALS